MLFPACILPRSWLPLERDSLSPFIIDCHRSLSHPFTPFPCFINPLSLCSPPLSLPHRLFPHAPVVPPFPHRCHSFFPSPLLAGRLCPGCSWACPLVEWGRWLHLHPAAPTSLPRLQPFSRFSALLMSPCQSARPSLLLLAATVAIPASDPAISPSSAEVSVGGGTAVGGAMAAGGATAASAQPMRGG